jgi:hypothetical protein
LNFHRWLSVPASERRSVIHPQEVALGNFYANFTLKHDDAAAVADALRKARRDAFVAADGKSKCVVVFDRETDSQDPTAIEKLGKSLSKKFACPVLATSNEDDDVFRYWLFEDGKTIDKFDSSFERVSEQSFRSASGGSVVIAKFDPKNADRGTASAWKPAKRGKDERGGNVQVLTEAFGVPNAAEKAMNVLLKEYDFVLDQHRALCKVLGLSSWAVGGSFEYVSAGELPKGLRKSQLIRVGHAADGG